MEFFEHNSHIDTIGVSELINSIINKAPKSETRSWYTVFDADTKEIWGYITKKLSVLESCKKLIKKRNRDEDIILFISDDISTKNIMRVNNQYAEILDEVDIFFELKVINEEEFKKYRECLDNELLWENEHA